MINKNSSKSSSSNRITSATITHVFINIPIPIENPTNPCRYSFFQGLKYVFMRRGRENSCKKALFKETKKIINLLGKSTNQNLKNLKGSIDSVYHFYCSLRVERPTKIIFFVSFERKEYKEEVKLQLN